MRIIKNPEEMQAFSLEIKRGKRTLGLVPTMGYLHEGHLSLVKAARSKADMVVVSIFVNPPQFGPGEDFNQYPRDLKTDKKLLKDLKVDILFIPDTSRMYPPGFKSRAEVKDLSRKMCGRRRPGHFSAVTTVVAKLFNIVLPDYAFFGKKDFQQQLIIKRMAKDLNFPVKIISLPVVRETDGLAMSSRNRYLTPEERKEAAILFRALSLAKNEVKKGQRDSKKIILKMRALIRTAPRVSLEYIVIADPETLEEVKEVKGKALIALAAHLGKARLIDNMVVAAK